MGLLRNKLSSFWGGVKRRLQNPGTIAIIFSSLFIAVLTGIIFRNQISTFFQTAVGANPVAYWKFDKGFGSTAYDSVGSNNGTFGSGNSAPTWKAKDQCVSATCLYFDGTDDEVSITESTSIDLGSTADSYTLVSWIKTGITPASNMTILSKDDGTNDPYHLYISNSGTICFQISDGTNNPSVCSTTIVTDNKWYSVAGIRDKANSNIMLGVNGLIESTATDTTTGNLLNNADVDIGKAPAGVGSTSVYYFDGSDTIVDNNGVWSNDANGFDGSISTSTSTTSTNSGNYIRGEGTNAPGSGGTISQVRTRAYINISNTNFRSFVYTNGKAESLGNIAASGINNNWSSYTILSTPTGGWSWSTLQHLEAEVYGQSTPDGPYSTSLYKQEIEVTSTSSSGSNYSGFLDEVKIYNYARTAAQIKADYTARGSTKGVSASFGDSDMTKRLSDGLIGYWKFDEASGSTGASWSVLDSSGNNNTGIGVSDAGPGAGKFMNAGSFDGTGDYISFSNFVPVTGGNPRSIVAWVNLTGNDGAIAAWGDYGTGENNELGVDGNGKLRFTIYNGGITNTNIAVSNQGWTQVAVVCKGSTLNTCSLWKNGQPGVTTTNTNILNTQSNSSLVIGKSISNLSPLKGSVDELRIYNRALDGAEIQALYNYAPGPNVYYKFDEGTGTSVVQDSSGVGATGSMNGMTNANWVSGKFGKALNFDGNDDYINTNDTMSIAGLSQFTISAWIYPRTVTGTTRNIYLECIASNCNTRLAFSINSSGGLAINARDDDGDGGTTNCLTDSRTLSTNTWTHIEAVYNADTNTHTTYINGIPYVDSGSGGCNNPFGTSVNASNKPKIGSSYDGSSNLFDGVIDDFKMYHYARTQEQVIVDMNADHPSIGTPVGSAVLQYKMNEGFGTTVHDSSPQGNDGTIAGSSSPSWSTNGKFGKALSFDGNDYITIGSGLSFSSAVTISAWINMTNYQTWTSILDRYGSETTDCLALGFDSSNGHTLTYAWNATQASGWANRVSGSATIPLNTWTQVAMSSDGTNGQFYINGKPDGSIKTVGAPCNTGPFKVGVNFPGSDEYYTGLIDDLRVYNFALSADQMKTIYNQGETIIMGANSTGVGGTTPSYSNSREYCVPGDTSTCSAPLGEWKFDEGVGGTANDTSGNGNVGTLATGNSAPSWVSGKLGKGLSFDGANDYVSIPTTVLNNMSQGTIGAWLKLNSNTAATIALKQSDGENTYAAFTIGSYVDTSGQSATGTAGKLYWHNQNSTTQAASTGTVSTGAWHYVVVTFDGSAATFYIDGVNSGSTSGNYSIPNDTTVTNSTIGNWIKNSVATNPLNGQLDQVRIYNYVRTPAQIAWEYNRGAPIAWYQLNDCTGTTAYNAARTADNKPAGNNGTISLGSNGVTSTGTCTTSGAWANGASGKHGASLSFDGSDDYIEPGNPATYIGNPTEGSISVWFNRTTTGSNKTLFYIGDSGTSNNLLSIMFSSSNTLQILLKGSSSDYYRGTVDLPSSASNGSWNNITFTVNTTGNKLYYNGVPMTISYTSGNASSTEWLDDITNEDRMLIGARDVSGITAYFTGQIDDVKIFNYALTSEQVKTEMTGGAVRFE